jgi:hypothetical protein
MDPMVTSKNTTGFFGFGGRWCHSTDVAVADGGVGPAEMAAPPVDAIAVLGGPAPEASRRFEAQPATGGGSFEGGCRGFAAELMKRRWRLGSRLSAKIRDGNYRIDADMRVPHANRGPHVGE